jgi:hypothetical protein
MAQPPDVTALRDASVAIPLTALDSTSLQTIARVLSRKRSTWGRIGDALLASAPTSAVALIGFYAVHHLSVRRQRRDEFFKLVQSSLEQVRTITADAVRAWSPQGVASADLDAVADELTIRVSRVSAQLALLTRRRSQFAVSGAVVAYRQAVTTDVEAKPRPGSIQRTGQIRTAGLALEDAIEGSYLSLFG